MACGLTGIILNRTSIYAASRRHIRLNWQVRTALRLVPIMLLTSLARSVLQAMRCQTSPVYPKLRNGTFDQSLIPGFAADGGFLYRLASSLLFWETEQDSCMAVNMMLSPDPTKKVGGSFPLLWPAFLVFCLSQFVDTLSCAIQGEPIATETGMSLFENSLAFAEAEAAVSGQLGYTSLAKPSEDTLKALHNSLEDRQPLSLPLEGVVLSQLNTPPEVLLMAFISCLNNLSSQILGVFGVQSRYRLINTGIWGICFMGSFAWGAIAFFAKRGTEGSSFRFPTVFVIGFIPHTIVLVGIFFCGCIYGLALGISVVSPPVGMSRAATWRERFRQAHENMQANVQLSGISFNMTEDFYTALLRIGFAALTAASEAVYLNEGHDMDIGQRTWLEEEQVNGVLQSRRSSTNRFSNLFGFDGGNEIVTTPTDNSPTTLDSSQLKSGYAHERSTKSIKGKPITRRSRNNDVSEGGQLLIAMVFLYKIFWLCAGWLVLVLIRALHKLGVERIPNWLHKLHAAPRDKSKPENLDNTSGIQDLEFWLLSDNGELSLPSDDNVDVELETKKRLSMASTTWGKKEDQQLDTTLYSWFINNGWWGLRDGSGSYDAPNSQDEDTTSVISMSTDESNTGTECDAGWESEASGQRTPTQRQPYPAFSRESTPADDLSFDPAHLAQLLNPRTPNQRAEAKMLSAHLSSPGPLTRSQYMRDTNAAKIKSLTTTNVRPPGFRAADASGKLNPEEEAEVLEYLLATVRQERQDRAAGIKRGRVHDEIANGPKCVVCQEEPRTIVCWPCRCLSLCDGCRISLAMNNFGTCVCCRQEVVSFSRLYVP